MNTKKLYKAIRKYDSSLWTESDYDMEFGKWEHLAEEQRHKFERFIPYMIDFVRKGMES